MNKAIKHSRLLKQLRQPRYLLLVGVLFLVAASSVYAYSVIVSKSRDDSGTSSENKDIKPNPQVKPETDDRQEATIERSEPTNQPTKPQDPPTYTNSGTSVSAPPKKSAAELENEKFNACYNEETSINNTYSSAVDRGWAARDRYKADVESQLSTSSLPEIEKTRVRFRAMYYGGLEANAIITPAYAAYVSQLDALRIKGCEVTQAYPDYTNDLSSYKPYL